MRDRRGDLAEAQSDEIGATLMVPDQRMAELCEQQGARLEDLTLDLGLLGPPLPRN
ncbi:MAG TPA: gas vesicle protein GvpK [Streptomyces sp.]